MRVIAHYMLEEEREAGLRLMPGAEVTDSYLIGEVAEADIPKLEEAGLIVQPVDPVDDVRAGELRTRGIVTDASRRGARGPSIAAAPPAGPAVYVIGLGGPLLSKWRGELEGLGVKLLEHIPRYAYTAKMAPEQVGPVNELAFVENVRLYDREDTEGVIETRRRTRGPRAASPVGGDERKMITYDVRLHPGEEVGPMLAWLEESGVAVAGSGRGKIRLYLLEDSPIYDEISDRPAVARIEPFVPPVLLNDVARGIMGLEGAGGPAAPVFTQTGAGQIVAVADTGIDHQHPDFQGRIVARIGLGRPADTSDPHGHGTHVAGSVLGDGSASGGDLRGTAPEAELFFQSLLDQWGRLGGLPLNLYDLFEEAYLADARIHSNSWGADTSSEYTLSSIEVDEFVADKRDMLVVIAAGNEGTAADNLSAPKGFVDWLSIDSPASAKNGLTVGASRSERTGVGYSDATYGQMFGGFPDAPIAEEKISDSREKMAAFSSRGPCTDRRIKPDLVAPGTDIASTKSSAAPLANFWGPYPSNGKYAFMGGTSMATPLVTGCAALVRQYFVDDRGHRPSAALLKATLINSTRWLSGDDATADHDKTPNYHQGFGCIHMPAAIPNPGAPDLVLAFADTWEAGPKLANTGEKVRYQVTVERGLPLRLCLTWTDLPARALQNNLNLFVQRVGSSRKWVGNADLPMSLGIPDPENNVEIVRIEDPDPGVYLIQVSATNLLQGGQDFALVATGKLTSGLVKV